MSYNFVADGFHIKKFVADFLQVKCDFRGKTAVLRFLTLFGDLGVTYDLHLRLIGKRLSISVN